MPTAVEMFLKIQGIIGESTVAGHQGEIELDSFSIGATNTGTAGTGTGGGEGKVTFQDFHFNSKIGKHTPQIFASTVNGTVHSTAVLSLVSASNKGTLVSDLKVSFTDAQFTEYKIMDIASVKLEDAVSPQGGLITSGPVDDASFSFRTIEVSTGNQTATATAGLSSTILDAIKKELA